MNALLHTTYINLRSTFRVKQSVFFNLVFPLFIFFLFSSIWGQDNDSYMRFLYFGLVAMTIASDGMFGVGGILREYYDKGFIKFLKKLPIHSVVYFCGFILSRFLLMTLTITLLSLSMIFVYSIEINLSDILYLAIGTIMGMLIFSFMGLCLQFISVRKKVDTGLVNFIYFFMLFSSNAFYPTKQLNKTIGTISDWLPLNPLLSLLREHTFSPILFIWGIIVVLLFYILYSRFKSKR